MTYRNLTGNQPVLCGVLIVGLLFAQCIGAASVPRTEAPVWQETLPALHIQVDSRRNRLWVLDDNAVYLYDIPTRKLIKRIELPGWTVVGEKYSCTPDLALAPSGAALVTSNVLPAIWEVDPQSLVVRQHRLVLDADNDKDLGFTALAFTRDRQQLLGVRSLLGSLWRIDLVADKAYKVRLGAPTRRLRISCLGCADRAPRTAAASN